MNNLPADFPSLPAENASLARLVAWFCEVVKWLVARAAAREAGKLDPGCEFPWGTVASSPRTGRPHQELQNNEHREPDHERRAASPMREANVPTVRAAASRKAEPAPSLRLTRPRPPRRPSQIQRSQWPQKRDCHRARAGGALSLASRPRSTADPSKFDALRCVNFARSFCYDIVIINMVGTFRTAPTTRQNRISYR